jgi:HD-like signal output (HDOD) protein
VFSAESAPRIPGFTIDSLSAHSMNVGRIAKRIVELERGPAKMRETALTAGLLHDLGKLVIAVNYPEVFTESLELAQAKSPLVLVLGFQLPMRFWQLA